MKAPRRTAGFTLIEIMLVVAILGVLVSVALPRLTGRTQEARIQAARMQIENLEMALDAFEFDCGRHPTTSEGLEALTAAGGLPGWKGPYMKKKAPRDPWGTAYAYVSPGRDGRDHDVFSHGPDRRDGGGDDLGNW